MNDPTPLTTPAVPAADVHARSASHAPPSSRRRASGDRRARSRAVRWFVSARRGSRVLGGMVSRRRSVDSVVVGCLLTLLVISFDVAGWLTPIEFLLYDARAAAFQFFLPRPTDKLVHLDISDGALETVGRWPCPRSVMAEVIDELAVAKPKVVGLDILFGEAQDPDWRPAPAAT